MKAKRRRLLTSNSVKKSEKNPESLSPEHPADEAQGYDSPDEYVEYSDETVSDWLGIETPL